MSALNVRSVVFYILYVDGSSTHPGQYLWQRLPYATSRPRLAYRRQFSYVEYNGAGHTTAAPAAQQRTRTFSADGPSIDIHNPIHVDRPMEIPLTIFDVIQLSSYEPSPPPPLLIPTAEPIDEPFWFQVLPQQTLRLLTTGGKRCASRDLMRSDSCVQPHFLVHFHG